MTAHTCQLASKPTWEFSKSEIAAGVRHWLALKDGTVVHGEYEAAPAVWWTNAGVISANQVEACLDFVTPTHPNCMLQATPVECGDAATGWRRHRMANVPHPSDREMRVIGFVVPKDDAPLGLVSERLEQIITTPPASQEQAQQPSVTVRYDLTPAMVEGQIRDKLIELGWTPPTSQQAQTGQCAACMTPKQCSVDRDEGLSCPDSAPQSQAEPAAQEAVAWMMECPNHSPSFTTDKSDYVSWVHGKPYYPEGLKPLYTTPQPAPASAELPDGIGAKAEYWGDLAQQKADADMRRGVTMPVSYYASTVVGAALSAQAVPNPWRDAVVEQLECWHIYVPAIHENSPRLAIKALVNIETQAALDPKVSSQAAALVAQAAPDERDKCDFWEWAEAHMIGCEDCGGIVSPERWRVSHSKGTDFGFTLKKAVEAAREAHHGITATGQSTNSDAAGLGSLNQVVSVVPGERPDHSAEAVSRIAVNQVLPDNAEQARSGFGNVEGVLHGYSGSVSMVDPKQEISQHGHASISGEVQG